MKILRGPSTRITTITPQQGQPLTTTDTKQLYIGDGTTPGGNWVGGAHDHSTSASGIIAADSHNHSNSTITSLNWTKLIGVPSPTITLTGEVTGSGTMTSLGNISINCTVPDIAITSVDWSKLTNIPSGVAKIQPQSGSYGSITITGSTSSYSGIRFQDAGNTLMVNPNYQGFMLDTGVWAWYVANGVFQGTATSARFADLAEKYTIKPDKKFLPGTVVCISEDPNFDIEVCDEFQCDRVIGVVSTNPAVLMNSECDGPSIARVGKVPCYVKGPCKKGDKIMSYKTGFAISCRLYNSYDNWFARANEDINSDRIKLIEIII